MRICVVTGGRADFGLLKRLLVAFDEDPFFDLKLIATGTHLSPEFGLTYKEIEGAGLSIDYRVEMLMSSDTAQGVGKSIGLGTIGCSDAFAALKPDLILFLGDRFEILAAATAGLVAGIPMAHLHGGEVTEGAFDDSIRHCLTKMSDLHFVANEAYRNRVVQLGENPNNVFVCGGLGVDSIDNVELISREVLSADLGISFSRRNLVVTFHPVTREPRLGRKQLENLLSCLAECEDTTLVFTLPNADNESRELIKLIKNFNVDRPNSYVFDSLGQQYYLSLLAQVDAVVGNSSSGLAEAPSFKVGTVNIGSRQDGRLKAKSVVDCRPERDEISAAINKIYSDEFRACLNTTINPYGVPGASRRIIDILKSVKFSTLLKRRFHDIVTE